MLTIIFLWDCEDSPVTWQMPQKQGDYKVEQSSFTLIALFDSKLVVVVVVIGLMEARLKRNCLFHCHVDSFCHQSS